MSFGTERSKSIPLWYVVVNSKGCFFYVKQLVMTTTNSFTAQSAQDAAAVHTYQVGAIVSTTTSDVTPGFIISTLPDDWYGVLLKTNTDSYSYTLLHASSLELATEAVSIKDRMKLKIASMVIRRPLPDVDYMIFNCKEEQ